MLIAMIIAGMLSRGLRRSLWARGALAMSCLFSRREETTFRVVLRPQGEVLGLLVAFSKTGDGLVIEALKGSEHETAIVRWNLRHPRRRVLPEQAILEINGFTKSTEMLAELRSSNSLDMLVCSRLTPMQQVILDESRRRNSWRNSLEVMPCVSSGEPCSICFDDMDGSTPSVQLPCGHCFHKACLVQWLGSSIYSEKCPLCNKRLEPCHDA